MTRFSTQMIRSCASLAVLLGGLTSATAQAPSGTALARCEDLAGLTLEAARIGLPTGGAVVKQASRLGPEGPIADKSKDPDGEQRLPKPARCLLQGEILPVDAKAPPIRFAVNMPLQWNGKALQSGGGGLGGAVITAPEQKASGRIDPVPLDAPYPLSLGYATFGSDGGHQGPDVGFIRNDEALRNWAGDALKKTRDVAIALITAGYGRTPDRTYFTGESAGARESLWVAQRYPRDYDGIIATSPVLSWTYIHLADNAMRTALAQGWLDADAIRLIAANTRKACDELDGLKDGVVARYMECPNTVAELRCPDGKPGSGCLSDAQINAVNTIRRPWAMDFPLAHGVTRYPGFGTTGDEDGRLYQWDFYTVGKERPGVPLEPGRGFERGRGAVLNFSNVWVRHAIAQDERFEPYWFDPLPFRERIQYLSALFDATDPDLGPLRTRGAKLIMYQPSADNAVGTPMVAEYYRSIVAAMGQDGADQVMRFYVGPGGGHNATGISQIDTLSLLEAWVERGTAPPDQITAVDIDPDTLRRGRSMPACRYPAFARYDGKGNPDAAESFRCTARPDPLAYMRPR
jgi:feruloyl esterase